MGYHFSEQRGRGAMGKLDSKFVSRHIMMYSMMQHGQGAEPAFLGGSTRTGMYVSRKYYHSANVHSCLNQPTEAHCYATTLWPGYCQHPVQDGCETGPNTWAAACLGMADGSASQCAAIDDWTADVRGAALGHGLHHLPLPQPNEEPSAGHVVQQPHTCAAL